MGSASRLAAQTDYSNTDAGRPLTIEDAYPVERRAIEFQLAPLRLARARGGVYNWGIAPEVALGVLPRTQLEVGLPLAYVVGRGGRRSSGLAGVELSMLHTLNLGTTAMPTLAVVGDILIPAGRLGPRNAHASLKSIATKTFAWARFHVNGQYTFGDRLSSDVTGLAPAYFDGVPGLVLPGHRMPQSGGIYPQAGDDIGPGATELSQWQAGVAVDRTVPRRSLLVSGEVFARQPLRGGEDVEWNTGGGVRYQLSARVAADAGAGYRLTGNDAGWFATFGAAVVVGLPGSGR